MTTVFKRKSRTCSERGGNKMKEHRKRHFYKIKTDHTSSLKLKTRDFTG
jgi:hypothetical protein